MILAHADVVARVEVGATLANDDVAGHDASPPNFFTPRYCGLESRPLRELDAPFLCAMIHGPFYNSGNRVILTIVSFWR